MRNPWILGLFPVLLTASFITAQEKEDYSIKVGVAEVRIDAIVLDKKGRQITGLTDADFEVFQDGKAQHSISCVYISSDAKPGSKSVSSAEAAKAEQMLSRAKLSKDEVRRTIAFLINGREYEAKTAIKKFIETQMEQGDLITILQGTPVRMPDFSSERDRLLSQINRIPGRQTIGGLGGIVDASKTQDQIDSANRRLAIGSFSGLMNEMSDDQYIQMLKNLLAPIRYAVRALKDMPGRKYLILMRGDISYDARKMPTIQKLFFDEVANEAWRAGVVIYTLDMKGLSSAPPEPYGKKIIPLSEKTGGMVVENSNFFFGGIGPVREAIRGYYLLSYIPPPDTFDRKGGRDYHSIKVKVKRSGAEVHSRDGFLGTSAPPEFATAPTQNSLAQAAFSPLLYTDIKMSLSSGYAHAPTAGYFLRSWMHLDGKELTFRDEKNGGHSLSLELLALTSDSNGRIQDLKSSRYDFDLSDTDIALMMKYGIDLKTYLPVQRPGRYYVSTALRDRASGKIGTGYQFLDIPDLGRSGLALSSILGIYNQQDESVLKTGRIEEDADSYNAIRKWRALSSSPALRMYQPGESLKYLLFVYNAADKEGASPELELKTTLFKDGQIYRQEAEPIEVRTAENPDWLPIVRRLVLEGMEEGDYLLQLTVADKRHSSRNATQVIDFQIRK